MLISPSLFALTTILQPGQTDGKDTAISMQNPDNNYNNESTMWMINKTWRSTVLRFGLFQFNLPSELSGATITNATFNFYVNFASFGAPSNNVTANNILSAWDETSVNWNTAPDYETTSIGSVTLIDKTYSMYQPYWAHMDITDAVQNWADGTWINNGFLLKPADSANENVEILTSDNPDASLHPKLTVEYTPSVPEPGVFLMFFLGLAILKRKIKR